MNQSVDWLIISFHVDSSPGVGSSPVDQVNGLASVRSLSLSPALICLPDGHNYQVGSYVQNVRTRSDQHYVTRR